MNLKGNNAERLATVLIIFFMLAVIYILICFAFNSITHSSLENIIKDGMGFSATCIAPIIAIFLVNDWRVQHHAVKLEADAEKIVKSIIQLNSEIDYLDAEIRKYKNKKDNHDDKYIYYDEIENKISSLKKRVIELMTDSGVSFDDQPQASEFLFTITEMTTEMLNFLELMRMAVTKRSTKSSDFSIEFLKLYTLKEQEYSYSSFTRFSSYLERIREVQKHLKNFKIH